MKKATDLRIPFSWQERRPILLERFMYVPNPYDRHNAWNPILWSDPSLFGNSHPVVLEYCSGNGQWICEKAKHNPQRNWVAIDLRFDRSRKTWARLHRDCLTNLYVICGEARVLTRYYFPKRSVSEIFINFPDPWPKLRHAKHRLMQLPFLFEMIELALPGAPLTLVTDDIAYKTHMLQMLLSCSYLHPLLPSPYYALDLSNYGTSYFSDLWKKKGRTIYFLPFVYEPYLPSLSSYR